VSALVASPAEQDKVQSLQRTLYRAAKADPGRKFHALYDKVHRRDVLERGWFQVRRNYGAPGIDRRTIADVEEYGVSRLLDELAADLAEHRYRPLPARRVWIPKPGTSEQRPLSIPAVRDRIVQAALKTVIEPVFEADFSPVSFGFRPKRSAHDALQVLIDEAWRGRRWVVETDIASCFEAIPHDQLMQTVEERICDRHILKLLRAMLRAGVMEGGVVRSADTGTPQGGVVSPLLCNVYLNRLDRGWKTKGVGQIVRYADDRATRTQGEIDVEGRTRQVVLCQRWWLAHRDRPAGGGPKPPQAAAVKSRGGKRCGKGGLEPVRYEPRRRAEANHSMTGRKRSDGIKSGVESLPRYESGGNLSTAQAVSGLKVARARFRLWHGTCEPATRYRPAVHWTCGPSAGESETPKWKKPRGAE
jgi:retron-type reverse transcriptase